MRTLIHLFALFLLGLYALVGTAEPAPRPIVVGVVDYVRPSPFAPMVEATLQALTRGFGEERIVARRLTMEELHQAIAQRQVDFFLSSAGFYRSVSSLGARTLASVASEKFPDPSHSDSTAFIVRNDSPFEHIENLQGKVLAAPTATGFTSYLIPMGEILRRGFDPDHFFSQRFFVGPGAHSEEAIDLVRDGKADVAFLRTCWLEEYEVRHPEEKGLYRVLDSRPGSPCLRSTDLYPTWIIGSTPSMTPQMGKKAMQILLEMPPSQLGGFFWTIPTDLSSVDQLYYDLRLGPYEYLRHFSFKRFFEQYRDPILLALLFIIGLIIHSIRVTQLVKHRTRELTASLAREKELQAEASAASRRAAVLQKIGIVGQLSSMVAHELRQPLGAIALYCSGLLRLSKRGTIEPQQLQDTLQKMEQLTKNASGIVDNVRSYAKVEGAKREPVRLSVVIKDAVALLASSNRGDGIEIKVNADPTIVFEANALEWSIVVYNLLKNAAEALQGQKEARIVVELVRTGLDTAAVKVSDNGPALTDAQYAKLTHPLESGKTEGLGLGLSIIKGILESYSGRLAFERRQPHGLCAAAYFYLNAPHYEKGITAPLGDTP